MREFFRELTINQMIALLVGVIVVLIIAAVLFSISQQEPDPFSIPTATFPVGSVTQEFQFRPATQAP